MYTSQEWNKLLTTTFAQYTDQKKISVNALRSAFVTHAKECDTPGNVMESLARVMRHSVRYQQNVYDRRTANERMKSGLEYAKKSLFRISDDDDDDNEAIRASPAKKKRTAEEEACVVVPGELVAVETNNGGGGPPTLAKVIQADSQMTLLQRMRRVEEGLYKPELGTKARWRQPTSDLIVGLDFRFDEEKRLYELLTDITDI